MSSGTRVAGAGLAGVIFALGWWIMLDGVISGPTLHNLKSLPAYGYIPAFFASMFIFLLNLVSLDDLNPQTQIFLSDSNAPLKIKIWLFIWTSLLFGCILSGVSIMIVLYPTNWMGWSIMLQPIFCLISAFVMLFSRRTPKEDVNVPF